MKQFLSFTLIFFTLNSFSQESTILRLRYNTGDTYLMKMQMTQDMGEAMKMNMLMEMPMEVTHADDTTNVAKMSFSRISMDMEQAGTNITYDSDLKEEEMDEAGKMMSSQMSPILGTVIAIKSNVYGEVLDLKMLEGSGNANQFADQAQSVVYPKEPISVGYSWTAEKENNGMTISSTYTVKSIEETNVNIGISGAISGTASGTLTGDLNIHKMSGVPTLSTINMDFETMGQKVKSDIVISVDKT